MTTCKWLLAAACLITGCAREPAQPAATAPEARPSTSSEIVDILTQRSAVRAGERAKDTIRKISAQEKQMLDEVTQEHE
jgi:uncharacterized lipoprotein YajG